MIYDANYVDAFETMALADDSSSASPRDIMHDEAVDAGPFLTPEEAIEQFLTMLNSQPAVPTMRTAAEAAEIGTSDSVAVAEESRPKDQTPGAGAAREQPADGLSQEQLQQRATRMFCGGREQLVASGGATLVTEVTLELIMAVKAAITAIFKAHTGRICSSPERQDLRLSQEEALGHLVGSLVVGEMLATEARPVGKRLDFYAGKEAKAQEKEKESARQKKKSLKKKKGLAPDELTKACEAVDEVVAEECTLRLAKVINLDLPATNSRIVERRAPKPDPTAARRRALEVMLGSQVAYDAIDAAITVEEAERDLAEFDDEGHNAVYEETSEEYELALVHYRHALERLKAAFPDVLNDCSPDGTCEHRRPCPCGRGVRGAWPWVVQTPKRGYCEDERDRGAMHAHFYSCIELHEERERWLHVLCWSDPATRAKRLGPNGERSMSEAHYRAQYESICSELY